VLSQVSDYVIQIQIALIEKSKGGI
jgi:hypothetical protein